VRKYIDDGLNIEKLNMSLYPTFIKEGKLFKDPLAAGSQLLFDHVRARAAECGMVVNGAKTGLVAVNSATGYEARAHMFDSETGGLIQSGASIKILGFIIDSDGGIASQVERIRARFRARVWMLRVAKRSGMSDKDLTLCRDEAHGGRQERQLTSDSAALLLIQQIRDEAHRFAITGHRGKRAKKRQQSVLEDIKGLGPKRRKQLLTHFGGLRRIQKAGVEDIAAVPGISHELASRVYDELHPNRAHEQ
jgi:hypothetical protein